MAKYIEMSTGDVYELLHGLVLDLRALEKAERAVRNNPNAVCDPHAHNGQKCACSIDAFDLIRPIVQIVVLVKKEEKMTEKSMIWDYDIFQQAFVKE